MMFIVDCGELIRCEDKDARGAALLALLARREASRWAPLPPVVMAQDLDSGEQHFFLVAKEGLA